MKTFHPNELSGFLEEWVIRTEPWITKAAEALARVALFFRRRLDRATNSVPGEDGLRPPDAGRRSPLKPSPRHHLVAANALPPSDETYLLSKD